MEIGPSHQSHAKRRRNITEILPSFQINKVQSTPEMCRFLIFSDFLFELTYLTTDRLKFDLANIQST